MNKKLLGFFALAAVAVAAGIAAFEWYAPPATERPSSLMVETGPVELAEEADYAVIGTVTNMVPMRTPQLEDNDTVVTDIMLIVEEDVFGNHDEETISFRILGGEADGLSVSAEDSPEFRLGEMVLVFVSEDPENHTFGGEKYLVGQAQGALEVTADGQLVDKYIGNTYNKDLVLDWVKQTKGIQ